MTSDEHTDQRSRQHAERPASEQPVEVADQPDDMMIDGTAPEGGRPTEHRLPATPFEQPRAAGPFAAGDRVLLLDRAGNRRLVRLRTGKQAHGHKGALEHDAIIGEPEGSSIRTSTGTVFVAVRPRLADYSLEMTRRTAIVYPKDVGIILVWADVYPGATVFEAGFGSGALTLALLRAVGPSGRVVVYEQRGDTIPDALANVRAFEEPRGELVVHERDVYAGIDERDVDRLVLDVPEPWQVIPHAADALRLGGIAAFYSPSIVQVQRTVEALEASRGFGQIESLEVLYRPWHVLGQAVRPVQQMISHTGFLTFARRLAIPRRRSADVSEADVSQVDVSQVDVADAFEVVDADTDADEAGGP